MDRTTGNSTGNSAGRAVILRDGLVMSGLALGNDARKTKQLTLVASSSISLASLPTLDTTASGTQLSSTIEVGSQCASSSHPT